MSRIKTTLLEWMNHSFKDTVYFYTVAVAQNVLTANLACKKKAQYQNYISDICLVLNIHDQLAALKVSLKDCFLLAQPTTHIYTHTHVDPDYFLSAFLFLIQYSETIG